MKNPEFMKEMKSMMETPEMKAALAKVIYPPLSFGTLDVARLHRKCTSQPKSSAQSKSYPVHPLWNPP